MAYMNYLKEDPSNHQNDYNHWKECHEALDNHLSERYLDIRTIEDLKVLIDELLNIADKYEFTSAKVPIQKLMKRVQSSHLSFDEAFTEAIDELDERINHIIIERKGSARRGLSEQVAIESIPPFEIHKEPWGDDVYFNGDHISCNEDDLDITQANFNPKKCNKLLVAFVRAEDRTLPVHEIMSNLTCRPHTVDNTISNLRSILGAFNRSTGSNLEIPRKGNNGNYEYYTLTYKDPNIES